MKYAKEWTILRGKEPKKEIVREFEALYSQKEQANIRKLMHTMLFSNYLMNYLKQKPWKNDPSFTPEPDKIIL